MHYKPYRVHRKRPLDFILPFLIIISVGVVIILAYQLFSTLTDEDAPDQVQIFLSEGKAKFLPWGTSDWQNVYSGMNFLPGDGLRTSKDGRAILEFFNGSVVRVAENSEVILQEVHREELADDILLGLNGGEVWINTKAEIGKKTQFSVQTRDLRVKTFGTVFDVLDNVTQNVHVLSGKVDIDVITFEEGEEISVESIAVGIGQEVSLSDKNIESLKARKHLNVLKAISDEFEDSTWYKWNILEDRDPTNFSPEVLNQELESIEDLEKVSVKPLSAGDEDFSDEEFEDIDPPTVPVIIEPAMDAREVTNGPVTISGTTAIDTEKIIVEAIIGGKIDKYTLSKYVPGSLKWAYAVSEQYGNLKPGENKYLIFALDKVGNSSAAAELIVNFAKPTQEQIGQFQAPLAVSFNGSLSNEVTMSPVMVKGTVSGAVSVTINDFTLSKFKAGDMDWIYYANEQHGNMSPGLNEYEVFAIDAEGNKSEVNKFQIIYKKPGVEPPDSTVNDVQ